MIRKLPQKISSYIVIAALVFVCAINANHAFAFLGAGDTVFDIPAEGTAAAALAKASASTAFEAKQVQSDIKAEVLNTLDIVAYNIAQQLSTKLTSSVVNWANGGFTGAPTFVQDFGNYFKQQGDQVLQSSLTSLQGISQNNPFARDLALQLINTAQTGNTSSLQQGLQFNLNQVIGPNYQQFYTNAGVGGWNAWNAIANPANNPVGSTLYLNQAVQNKTIQLNNNTQLEALGGGGFLNIKKCVKWGTVAAPGITTFNGELDADGNLVGTPTYNNVEVPHDNPANCEQWETTTPGGAIKSSLDKALGVPQDRLTKVDKYKQLLSASLTNLITGLTNAGLKALIGSFTQQPIGSVGMSNANQNSWLNQPNQIVDIDEVQQIRKPDGTLAINPDRPNTLPAANIPQTPALSPGELLRP